MEQPTPKPSERLKIRIGDQEHELLMTYGLLTRLTIISSSADSIIEGTVDPTSRDAIIITCLTKNGRSGVLDPGFDFEDLDMSVAQVEEIFDWAMSHLIDFFMRRLEAGARISAPYKDRLQALTSSIAGSEA
mgnify:CR=1 FL=1